MSEERITEVRGTDGSTHTTILRETEAPRRSGGGGATLIALLVLLAVLAVGAVVMLRGQDSRIARDNAVAEAAGEVGRTAKRVGNAVEDTAKKITPQ